MSPADVLAFERPEPECLIDPLALCLGPTGSCVREAFHGGDHIRPDERDLRTILAAAKLLRAMPSYGNPGWSLRQHVADDLFAMLGGE